MNTMAVMDLVRIYVQDHEAAAQAGRALARRCAASNRDNDLGCYLDEQFLPQIESDQDCVVAILEALGAKPSQLKRIAMRAGEIVGRAKLNGRIRDYSPLSRVLELEALIAGVHAKQRLWVSIDTMNRQSHSSLPDVSDHRHRAETQLAELQTHQNIAIQAAFIARPGQTTP